MLGTSREALAALEAKAAGLDAAVAGELLQAAAVFGRERALRIAVVDSGQSVEAREHLVRDLFGAKLSSAAVDVIAAACSRRWASADDLAPALESVAAGLVFAAAAKSGELDAMEEEIFRFARAADANPELQMALTNPATDPEVKAGIVNDLLAGKAHEGTVALVAHAAANLRGRRVDVALQSISESAAAARNRMVASVRVAVELTSEQRQRLAAVLGRLAGREVSLNVVVDPNVVGGVSVRLGDELIDGSVRTRLDQARRALVG